MHCSCLFGTYTLCYIRPCYSHQLSEQKDMQMSARLRSEKKKQSRHFDLPIFPPTSYRAHSGYTTDPFLWRDALRVQVLITLLHFWRIQADIGHVVKFKYHQYHTFAFFPFHCRGCGGTGAETGRVGLRHVSWCWADTPSCRSQGLRLGPSLYDVAAGHKQEYDKFKHCNNY